jgi:hypothetical protein
MTHYTAHTGAFSAIDLAMCTPSLSLDLELEVIDDLYGCDHFPLLLRFKQNLTLSTQRRLGILKRLIVQCLRSSAKKP